MRETYKNIPGDLCDFHDFYQRMAESLPSGARIVEVGVADGHSAIFLAERLADLGKNFELYMVDSLAYGGTHQANTIIRNITRSGLADKITFMQMSSLDASCTWPDNWADFVFLDSSHTYEQTKAEIQLWHRKVKFKATLSGHDFNDGDGIEVSTAVRHTLRDFEEVKTKKGLGVWVHTKQQEHAYVD